MKSPALSRLALHPVVWAVPAGVCLALSFPLAGIAGLAWIAPGLILAAAGLDRAHAFRTGFIAGLAHQLIALHWLLNIPVTGAPILGWLALSAYLALYTGTWTWLCCRLEPPRGPFAAAPPQPFAPALPGMTPAAQPPAGPRFVHARWALQCAALWTALELVQSRLFTGFPWNLLGSSQYRQLPLIQIASFTGIAGLTFLITWCSVALLCAARSFRRAPMTRGWRLELLPPMMALVAVVTFGLAQIMTARPATRSLNVALIQPSIPQTLIWDPAGATNRFEKLLRLTEAAAQSKPDLIVWPEAAVPDMLRYDSNLLAAVTGLARTHGAWMIVGSDDAAPNPADPTGRHPLYFNSAFLITPTGELVAKYDKQRLVIFGEYVPLVRWLPFLNWFTPITGGFTPGRSHDPFVMLRPLARTAVLICFEDVFATLARAATGPDTDFLLNLTNNGWFGAGAAQWQHAAAAVFRAVENRIVLVRCTNNGLTCWIDRFGGIHEAGVGADNDYYGAGFRLARIPLRDEAAPRERTLFHQRGDWFAWLCAASAAWMFARHEFARRRAAKSAVGAAPASR